jgi:hypothetical protein
LTDRGYDVSILMVTDGLDGWSCGWYDPGFLTRQQVDNVLRLAGPNTNRAGKMTGLTASL